MYNYNLQSAAAPNTKKSQLISQVFHGASLAGGVTNAQIAASVKQSSISGSFVSSNKHSSSVSNPKQLMQTLNSIEITGSKNHGRNNALAVTESQASSSLEENPVATAKSSFY